MSSARRPGFTKERGYEEPLYYQTPRCLVREGLIKELTEGSLKTLTVFYYLTFYYKTDKVKISLDVLMEHTGISRPAQCKATKDLESKGHIIIEKGAQGTPSTYRMNIENGSDSYVAFVEHRKPPKQKHNAPKPQDVGGSKECLPVGDQERMFTSTGKECLPPIIDTTKGVPKGSEEPTPTNPPLEPGNPGGGGKVITFQIGNNLVQDWAVDPESVYPLEYKRACEKAIREEDDLLYPDRKVACSKYFKKYLDNHWEDYSSSDNSGFKLRKQARLLLASFTSGTRPDSSSEAIRSVSKILNGQFPSDDIETMCTEVMRELEGIGYPKVLAEGGMQL